MIRGSRRHCGWREWSDITAAGCDDPDYTVLRLFPRLGAAGTRNHTYRFVIGDRSE